MYGYLLKMLGEAETALMAVQPVAYELGRDIEADILKAMHFVQTALITVDKL